MWKLLITRPRTISDLNATLPDITVPLTYQMFMLDGPLSLEGLMQSYDETLAPVHTRIDITNTF